MNDDLPSELRRVYRGVRWPVTREVMTAALLAALEVGVVVERERVLAALRKLQNSKPQTGSRGEAFEDVFDEIIAESVSQVARRKETK